MRSKPLLFFFMSLRSVAHLLPQHNLIYLDGHRPFSYFTGRQKNLKGEKTKLSQKDPLGVEPCGPTQAKAVGGNFW